MHESPAVVGPVGAVLATQSRFSLLSAIAADDHTPR
jgi:hypothetical protein